MSSKLSDFVNELFDKIARENGFRNFSIEILDSDLQPGDFFNSEIFRIRIIENESSKKLELVCKIAPTSENYRKEFSSHKLFRREAHLYQNFLPMLEKFQQEKQLPACDQFRSYAKCYGCIIDDEKQQYAIVLEDLRPRGFEMWDKTKPTSIENACHTMRELGKFHGLSIAAKDQKPTEFNEFKQWKSGLNEILKSSTLLNELECSYAKAIDYLRNDDHRRIVREFKSNSRRSFAQCLDEKATDRIGVLCHGDCWNNNLLFRFNEKGVADGICFLDWQYSYYRSPAIDILYNIFTSTDKPLRDKEYDNLIKLYYDSMSKMVKSLGNDPEQLFTYDDLLSELKTCGVYALLLVPLLLQILQADSSETPNLHEAFNNMTDGEDDKVNIVAGLTTKGELEYERRLNEVFEDVIELGYYN